MADELSKRIPWKIEETRTAFFYPALYQCLASELGYYKGTFYCPQTFDTNAFRQAYHYEDRLEILDELGCELRDRICALLGVTRLKYGLRIKFITYNQWLIDYIEESE